MDLSGMSIEDQANYLAEALAAHAYRDRDSYDEWRRDPVGFLEQHGFDVPPEGSDEAEYLRQLSLSVDLPEFDEVAEGVGWPSWKEWKCIGCELATGAGITFFMKQVLEGIYDLFVACLPSEATLGDAVGEADEMARLADTDWMKTIGEKVKSAITALIEWIKNAFEKVCKNKLKEGLIAMLGAGFIYEFFENLVKNICKGIHIC